MMYYFCYQLKQIGYDPTTTTVSEAVIALGLRNYEAYKQNEAEKKALKNG